MGTNFYYYPAPYSEKIHIGKSSSGWCFSLHVYPSEWDEPRIQSLDDWRALFAVSGSRILNEYGEVVDAGEMLEWITRRSEPDLPVKRPAEWYSQNNASPGPNGLARHRIDGQFCIGHGEGTWDYLIGEFS